MAKAIFVPIAGGAPSGAGKRRYLSRDAKQEALDALAARKREVGGKDDDPATSELQRDYGGKKPATWDMLRHSIDRSWRRGSKTWEKANRLAAKLLGKPLEDITSGACPDREVGAQDEPRRDQPQVSYPEMISDYRAIIVGQMPSADLHPLVIVKPGDGRDYWYPQHAGNHNPVVAGCAFSCMALFGDPDVRGCRKPGDDDVQAFLVHVYALASPWNGKSDRIKDKNLADRLKGCTPEYVATFTIKREVPAANSVTIADGEEVKWKDEESRDAIRCNSPVTISWVGTQATVEVREAEGDRFLAEKYGTSPVILVVGSRGSGGGAAKHHILLHKAGLYRVRLHPRKPAFIAPLFEWWLRIENTAEQGARIVRTAKHLSPQVVRPAPEVQAK